MAHCEPHTVCCVVFDCVTLTKHIINNFSSFPYLKTRSNHIFLFLFSLLLPHKNIAMQKHILRCTDKMLVGHKITMRTIPFLLLASHTRVHITYVTFKLKLTRSFKDLTLHLFKGIKKYANKNERKTNNVIRFSLLFLCSFVIFFPPYSALTNKNAKDRIVFFKE